MHIFMSIKTQSLDAQGAYVLGCLRRVQFFPTPRPAPCQSPLSMAFSSKNPGVGCYFLLYAWTH